MLVDKVTVINKSFGKDKAYRWEADGDDGYRIVDEEDIRTGKILEINIDHDIFNISKSVFEDDKEKLKIYTGLLYNQVF